MGAKASLAKSMGVTSDGHAHFFVKEKCRGNQIYWASIFSIINSTHSESSSV